jgi:hypothetical protein
MPVWRGLGAFWLLASVSKAASPDAAIGLLQFAGIAPGRREAAAIVIVLLFLEGAIGSLLLVRPGSHPAAIASFLLSVALLVVGGTRFRVLRGFECGCLAIPGLRTWGIPHLLLLSTCAFLSRRLSLRDRAGSGEAL